MGPEIGRGGVERFLPAAEDEDECAFVNEAPGCGEANAGRAAGNHSGLSIQSVHVVRPSKMEKTILQLLTYEDN
jgi:hypothetical protein